MGAGALAHLQHVAQDRDAAAFGFARRAAPSAAAIEAGLAL